MLMLMAAVDMSHGACFWHWWPCCCHCRLVRNACMASKRSPGPQVAWLHLGLLLLIVLLLLLLLLLLLSVETGKEAIAMK